MRGWLIKVVAGLLIAIGIVSLAMFFCTRVLERGPMAQRIRGVVVRELSLAGELLLKHVNLPQEGRPPLPAHVAEGAVYMLFDHQMHLLIATGNAPKLPLLAKEARRTGELVGGTPMLFKNIGDKELRTARAMPFVAQNGETYYIAERLTQTGDMNEEQAAWTGLRLAAIVLAIGVLYLLLRLPAHPAREMRKALRRLARGEYDARVPMDISFKGDELAKLACEFNAMAEHMGRLHAEQQRLFGEISHEMRSPLSRMSLAVELAGRSVPPETARLINRIRRDADRLGTLSNEMLELAKCQRPVNPEETVNLTALIRQVVDDSRFEAEAGCKRVACGILPEGLELSGNRETLYRMLENVVRNGLRHTPQGTAVSVTLSVSEHAARNEAVIRIADQGTGVAPEELQNIFKPFVRGSSSHGLEGKGLGLAITRHVAMRHGGSVFGENSPDGGFLVTIRLPVTVNSPPKTAIRRLAIQFS
ncbi:ATP-binding protein [Desulfovibrio mangrovi]|uniref:sensor histidine kinase n=1 Tax=Desulfovibrio mangrovi TaxID=2976983 RepID=UPI002247E48E|nr:ATP-binding protein [Desulfovibrio mangrovi]UZP68787.1 ATP-binding protein [Desulfovibrio mangrovi]